MNNSYFKHHFKCGSCVCLIYFLKMSTVTPGQPHTPEVNSITKSTMVVEWDKPVVDGGSAVTGYYLEKRDKKSLRWIRVYKDPVTVTKQAIYHLTEGNEYQYRVCAINKAGEGPFSEASDCYKAADPVGKYLFIILDIETNLDKI